MTAVWIVAGVVALAAWTWLVFYMGRSYQGFATAQALREVVKASGDPPAATKLLVAIYDAHHLFWPKNMYLERYRSVVVSVPTSHTTTDVN